MMLCCLRYNGIMAGMMFWKCSLYPIRIDIAISGVIISARFFRQEADENMRHEIRSLSAAGHHLPVAMSAAFAFISAVRFFGALRFYFFSGWYIPITV